MKKFVLQFNSLADVAQFAKTLQHGYIINTTSCTIIGQFTPEEMSSAKDSFKAAEPEMPELLDVVQNEAVLQTHSQPFYYN